MEFRQKDPLSPLGGQPKSRLSFMLLLLLAKKLPNTLNNKHIMGNCSMLTNSIVQSTDFDCKLVNYSISNRAAKSVIQVTGTSS